MALKYSWLQNYDTESSFQVRRLSNISAAKPRATLSLSTQLPVLPLLMISSILFFLFSSLITNSICKNSFCFSKQSPSALFSWGEEWLAVNACQPRLCPCPDLCLLNNSCLVYFSRQELRSSRSHRLKHWVPARHSEDLLHSPRSPVGDGGGGCIIRLIWEQLISVEPSVSSSPIACTCVLHHCEVVINRQPTKWRTGGGGGVSPLPFYRSISSWKSPHLLWDLFHSSLIVTSKTHLPSAAVCVYGCVCVCVLPGERGKGKEFTACNLHL